MGGGGITALLILRDGMGNQRHTSDPFALGTDSQHLTHKKLRGLQGGSGRIWRKYLTITRIRSPECPPRSDLCQISSDYNTDIGL
jgi:hypothetical protein